MHSPFEHLGTGLEESPPKLPSPETPKVDQSHRLLAIAADGHYMRALIQAIDPYELALKPKDSKNAEKKLKKIIPKLENLLANTLGVSLEEKDNGKKTTGAARFAVLKEALESYFKAEPAPDQRLRPHQLAALLNDLGSAYFHYERDRSRYFFARAKLLIMREPAEIPEATKDIIDRNIIHTEDIMDAAAWDTIRDKLFQEQSGSHALNLAAIAAKQKKGPRQRLIPEVEKLEFPPQRYRLLRRLCLKDDYTFAGHSLGAAVLANQIVSLLNSHHQAGITQADRKILLEASIFHDVGKASQNQEGEDIIPDYILKAQRRANLNQAEMRLMQTHAALGEKDLKQSSDGSEQDERMIQIAIAHHRRRDGSGYPEHIELDINDQLLKEILGFADTLEAMTAIHRPYQNLKRAEIVEIITAKLKTKFDPRLIGLIKNPETREELFKLIASFQIFFEKIIKKAKKKIGKDQEERMLQTLNATLKRNGISLNPVLSDEIIALIRTHPIQNQAWPTQLNEVLTKHKIPQAKQKIISSKITKMRRLYHGI